MHALMSLEGYSFDPDRLRFEPAHQELLDHIRRNPDSNHTWGYFPELNPSPVDYPACLRLDSLMQTEIIDRHTDLRGQGFNLAFIRAATTEPVSEFGGMHIDVHPGVGHKPDPNMPEGAEIVRLLLNPFTSPRRLSYVPLTRIELAERETDVPRSHYKILELPDDIPIEAVEIPPLEEGQIFGLRFVSSLLPHAGITDSQGHFLVAYGAYG
jgi:hypothetical protein